MSLLTIPAHDGGRHPCTPSVPEHHLAHKRSHIWRKKNRPSHDEVPEFPQGRWLDGYLGRCKRRGRGRWLLEACNRTQNTSLETGGRRKILNMCDRSHHCMRRAILAEGRSIHTDGAAMCMFPARLSFHSVSPLPTFSEGHRAAATGAAEVDDKTQRMMHRGTAVVHAEGFYKFGKAKF